MESDNLKFLYGLTREGIKLDLAITRQFAHMLGDPQNEFRSFHVAGTNGKGSTSAYIYNILRKKYHTGLYTSPHLVKFNERIIFDTHTIPDQYIESFIDENRPKIQKLGLENRNPTFFETTTIMAYRYFADQKAQYASVEVGLGGRLDSTNIIDPEASIITQIGYEHADKLGCSLTSIAFEKGGIIKPGRPIILGDQKPEVVSTITRLASVRNSPLVLSWKDASVRDLQLNATGSSFRLETPVNEYRIETTLPGRFQVRNIASAVLAVEKVENLRITKGQIEKGIKNTRWPGRMEIINREPLVMVDCAHNPPAANALANSLSEFKLPEPTLVIGMLSDKDTFSFLHAIRKISGRVIFTIPNEPLRAVRPEKLAEIGKSIFSSIKVVEDPLQAYGEAKESSEFTLVTGSMYLVGAIMESEKMAVMPYHED